MIFDFIKTDGFANFLYWLRNLHRGVVVINSWVLQKEDRVLHNNLGDDINVYLIQELTGRPVITYFTMWRKYFDYTNFMCIGSIIEDMTNSHSIIWGAGAMYGENHELAAKPKKVISVRGKKTRDYLLSKGVSCPEVYGDPAILLPLIYKPGSLKKRYKLGIVPHVIELNHPLIQYVKSRNFNDVCIIEFRNYDDWHSVIDKMCSCDRILSSSLHGLIISNAYGIASKWMKLSDGIMGGTFKFRDFFSVYTDIEQEPLDLSDSEKIDVDILLTDSFLTYNVKENVKSLIKTCPFLSSKMKDKYIKSIPTIYNT